MNGPAIFTFLNQTGTLATAQDWNSKSHAKLWLYNAHYFDDLVAIEAASRLDWHRDLIRRWIDENPPGTGNGWEPYPTSLRIVNWVKWLASGNAPVDGMVASLACQADWLSRRLEYHLLGNHLFANAKALTFAGAMLNGAQADQWLNVGLAILKRETPEQILPDGGHFERSIMYHAILTEDVLDLIQMAQLFPDRIDARMQELWQATASRMVTYLHAMSHPDGQIAFFNDGAFGIAPEPSALMDQAQRLGLAMPAETPELQRFSDSGYTRIAIGPALLLADTAPIGPDYLPGHAHADTLSLEFSLDGQRIFVNGGTSVYGGDPAQRMLERSTRQHNTVSVQDESSSEVWAEFRVARRAKVLDVHHGRDGETHWLEATHDGFRRFNGPLHTRRWELSPTSLTIHDTLDRPNPSAVARFRLHPELTATPTEISCARPIRVQATGGTLCIEDGTWSPEFGKVARCPILVLRIEDQSSRIIFTWDD